MCSDDDIFVRGTSSRHKAAEQQPPQSRAAKQSSIKLHPAAVVVGLSVLFGWFGFVKKVRLCSFKTAASGSPSYWLLRPGGGLL